MGRFHRFCFDVFLKSLKHSDSVSFGYEHDAILFHIEKFTDIELINIDHHDDILGGNAVVDECEVCCGGATSIDCSYLIDQNDYSYKKIDQLYLHPKKN